MTVPGPMPIDRLRAMVADTLGEPHLALSEDDDLLDHGLDSIRLMSLVEQLRTAGYRVELIELAQQPTLGDWLALLARTAKSISLDSRA